MQNSDPTIARTAVERAIVLKKGSAVDHIEIVFGGDGVLPVAHADEQFKARLEYANSIGIAMSGCDAGLSHNNLTAADLPSFFSTFPYGIVRTLDLVGRGYTVMQY